MGNYIVTGVAVFIDFHLVEALLKKA